MGAGKMGSFFIDLLSFDHEVAVYEKDAKRLRFTYNCYRFTKMEEIEMFRPELAINAVTVKYTLDRKSTRLNSSHKVQSRMPSSA